MRRVYSLPTLNLRLGLNKTHLATPHLAREIILNLILPLAGCLVFNLKIGDVVGAAEFQGNLVIHNVVAPLTSRDICLVEQGLLLLVGNVPTLVRNLDPG